ncbi:YnfA family protein [Lichenicola sp.]|uniref:YnfA family protein n=1 Tax=Lichenicola sp. TaxID=2804529 RepID=UPI003AFFC51C
MTTLAAYALAALAEIAGCYGFWAWARNGRSALWLLPAVVSLVLFAWLLTRIDTASAGRAYASYGGIYIAASLLWLWAAEGVRPDRWDLAGGAICLVGSAVILLARH